MASLSIFTGKGNTKFASKFIADMQAIVGIEHIIKGMFNYQLGVMLNYLHDYHGVIIVADYDKADVIRNNIVIITVTITDKEDYISLYANAITKYIDYFENDEVPF